MPSSYDAQSKASFRKKNTWKKNTRRLPARWVPIQNLLFFKKCRPQKKGLFFTFSLLTLLEYANFYFDEILYFMGQFY